MTDKPDKSRRHPLRVTVTAYVGFMVIWLALRLLFFDSLLPVALLNTIAEYLFVPLPLLLILAWWRDRVSVGWLIIPTAMFILLFGELFLPRRLPDIPDDAQTLTAMTFNLLTRNDDHAAIVASIRAADTDIIGVQEIRRSRIDPLVAALEDSYSYHSFDILGRDREVGLFSRYPIESAEYFGLPPYDEALHAIIDVEGQPVHIFVTHFASNNFFGSRTRRLIPLMIERYDYRALEVSLIQSEMAAVDGPIVMLCDCNLTDTSEAWARLDSFLDDSFREAGWGLGHSLHPRILPFPIQRIDYVWHSEHFISTHAFVGQPGGSDHLPVIADLTLISSE